MSLHGGYDIVVGLSPGAELEFTNGSGTATCAWGLGHGWDGSM